MLVEVSESPLRFMANTNFQLEQLKLLYDYTKFHIGLYGTLIAGFIGILTFGGTFSTPSLIALKVVVFLLLVAAMSGGMVASSVVDVYQDYKTWNTESGLEAFWTTPIGPFKWLRMKVEYWWFIEHTAFWIAVFIVVGGFLLKGIRLGVIVI